MTGSILYLDSSALVKLIVPEAETIPLFRLLLAWPYRLASEVGFVEVHRAVRRVSREYELQKRAEDVLSTIHFMDVHMGILVEASLLEPLHLKSLDAIHIATAVTLGSEVGGFVTYDRNMRYAALQMKLNVLAPS